MLRVTRGRRVHTLDKNSMIDAQRKQNRFRYLSALPLIAAIVFSSTPAAFAATYTYANWVSSSQNQYFYSGTLNHTGGYGELETFGPGGPGGYIYLETYYDYPGYVTHGFMSGVQKVTLTHTKAFNSLQKCHWDWPWSGGGSVGNLDLFCRATY